MDLQHIKKVQEWVELDNKVLRNKEQMKEHVERKKELEDDILQYVESNKIDNLSLNISDGTIKFSKKTNTQPLSIKVIKACLEKYSSKNNVDIDVDDICNFINASLEKRSSSYMKRDFK